MSKEKFKAELKTAESLEDVFNITNKYYNTKAKLGFITKGVLLVKIDTLINATGIKLKP